MPVLSNKLRILCLAVAFLLVVGSVSVKMAVAWVGPSLPPPEGNMPAPLHIGDTAQYKTGNLTLGQNTTGPEELNICTTSGGCKICLNGTGSSDCIDEWPTGGSGGSDIYWDLGVGDNFIYPKVGSPPVTVNSFRIYEGVYPGMTNPRLYMDGMLNIIKGDLSMGLGNVSVSGFGRFSKYGRVGPGFWANNDDGISLMAGGDTIASGFYVKANTNAIEAEIINDGVSDPPTGRGAIIGRDDADADGSPIWGILGVAGGKTINPSGSYLNYGVYGYAPEVNGYDPELNINYSGGTGVRGSGGSIGVAGNGNSIGVSGVGGIGGSFMGGLGSYGVIAYGSTGLRAEGEMFDYTENPPVHMNGAGWGIMAYGGEMGVQSRADATGGTGDMGGTGVCSCLGLTNCGDCHSGSALGVLSKKIGHGSIQGGEGLDAVPEEVSLIGVMGRASNLPVVGFNSANGKTYGALGRKFDGYGGYLGTFGRGGNIGAVGIGPVGMWACGASPDFCNLNQPGASIYGIYSNIDTGQDAIKGICNSCSSAIAGINYGTGNRNGLYGQVTNNNSDGYAGYFDGQIFVDGVDWQDSETIGVKIGAKRSGDTITGTKNLWIDVDGTGDSSVRINDKLEVNGDIAIGRTSNYVQLTEDTPCDNIVGGDWDTRGSFGYRGDEGSNHTAYLCVLITGVNTW